jgi:DNA primase
MDFVSRYVELKEMSSGAVGLCPFHDDAHYSFGISKTGNYWNCFAGCGGGDIISFWMKYRGFDFKTALEDLRKRIGDEDGYNPDRS